MPSRRAYHFSAGCELLAGSAGFHGSLLILEGRIEDADEPAYDQIIDLPFFVAHVIQLDIFLGGNDRMMVAYFLIVYEGFAGLEGHFQKLRDELSVRTGIACPETFLDRRDDISADVAGICPGVRKDLVMLVQTLHDVQRLFRGEAEAPVGVSL